MTKPKDREAKTIIIADDHPMLVKGLTSVIHEFTPYKVIAEVSNGKELLHILNSKQPDMILLDINMPRLNGILAAERIKTSFPEVKIIVISMYGDDALRQLKKGSEVDGFISKLSEGKVFIQSIKKVMEGKKVFNKEKPVAQPLPQPTDDFQNKMKLSQREMEILLMIKKGLTTKTISLNLHLSIHTVNTHRKNICRKLNITSPNGLVKFAFGNTF